MTNNLISILALREVKGIGASAIKKLYTNNLLDNDSYYATIENSLRFLKKNATDNEVEQVVSIAKELIEKNIDEKIKLVDLSSDNYPYLLKESKGPPSVLFYKGDLTKATKAIGIIGTRDASPKSNEIARRISQHYSEANYNICNGLAVGIDEACITTTSGLRSNVVGVVAGGLNFNKTRTLLKSTALLAEKVLENGGLVLSEFPANIKEDTFKVVDSCAIQAALSQGLILVQSKADGGSKYTLRGFSEFNRPLGVVVLPDMLGDASFEANNILIANGKEGLAKITGLKTEKIAIQKVISISQKADYNVFENAMVQSKDGFPGQTLFN